MSARHRQAEEVVAYSLCPSYHRHGFGWSLRNNEGLVSVGTSVLTPCAEHVGAARVAIAALINAGLLDSESAPSAPEARDA